VRIPHRKKIIKVNASVDRGIIPLVTALNRFPGILTLDSCQEDSGAAYVYFCLSESNGSALPLFCRELARLLSAARMSIEGFQLSVEWPYDCSACMARLTVPTQKVEVVALAIARIANRHRTRFSCGTLGRAPRSSQDRRNLRRPEQ
jgi:hypothetical protein